MTPSVRKILEDRLKQWAIFRRHVANEPGIGYPHINTLKRIMSPNPGDMADAVAPRDWAPEMALDNAIQIMQFLQFWPEKYAVEIDALWPNERLGAKVSTWNIAIRSHDAAWKDLRSRSYQTYRQSGLSFLAGRLALDA